MHRRRVFGLGLLLPLACGGPPQGEPQGGTVGTSADDGDGDGATAPTGASGSMTSGGGSTGPGDGSGSSAGETGLPPPLMCDDATTRDLTRGQWTAVGGNDLQSVCACEMGFPDVCAVGNCYGPFAYSGGIVDPRRNRFIVWGGGHNDYYGNELYAFDIATRSWSRLNDPSDPGDTAACLDALADGAPSSRHTYDGLVYLADQDLMLSVGGAHACQDGGSTAASWLYDFTNEAWSLLEPTYVGFGADPLGEIYGSNAVDIATAWDPDSGLVFIETTYTFSSYDAATNTWTKEIDLWDMFGGRWAERSGVLVPDERLFLSIGSATVYAYDLSAMSVEEWTTTGGEEIVAASAPGLTYDSVAETVVAWSNGNMYTLDIASRTWTQYGQPLNPGATSQVYGRFEYLECEDAFIAIVPDPSADVQLFRK